MYNDAILRFTAGSINKINDAVIGMPAAPLGPGISKFQGQLGAGAWLDDNQVLYTAAMGTVYGGHFRYVRLAAAALAVVVGQVVFWDLTVADSLFQVTTSESGGTDAAVLRAGVVLNSGWTPGNYSIIQDVGPIFTKFRAALTDAGAIGSPVFCAGAGGADLGFADVINNAGGLTQGDWATLNRRWIGTATVAPGNGSLTLVYHDAKNLRG